MNAKELDKKLAPAKRMGPFRRAVLRGLGILLPPLLTIVIFLWMGNTVAIYLLNPLENATRWVMVEYLADIRTPDEIGTAPEGTVTLGGQSYAVSPTGTVTINDEEYKRTGDGRFVPARVFKYVRERVGKNPMPAEAKGVYAWYVDHFWLPRQYVVPLFLCVFLLILYLLGKFLAAGVGRFIFARVERVIERLPLVRNVYGSVKQVTDFLFSDNELHYTRAVAIEYPRKGVWTLCFVTGEGIWDIAGAAKEPVLSVFVPTSPMPLTGFALTVKKSEVVELSISIDQAIQFVVSCGVVVPPPIIGVPQIGDGQSTSPPLSMKQDA